MTIISHKMSGRWDAPYQPVRLFSEFLGAEFPKVRRRSMLFHVEQVHTPENCPYAQGGSRSLHDATVPGVRLVAMYGNFVKHVIYLIVEATDIDQLNAFLLPGMKTCTATITPVSDHPIPPPS